MEGVRHKLGYNVLMKKDICAELDAYVYCGSAQDSEIIRSSFCQLVLSPFGLMETLWTSRAIIWR